MKALGIRPLGCFAFVFYVFSCIFFSLNGEIRAWCCVVLFLLFAGVLLFGKRIPHYRAVAIMSAALAASALYSGFVLDVYLERMQSVPVTREYVTVNVTGIRYSSSWRGCYDAVIDGSKVVLYSDNCDLAPGDVAECIVVHNIPDETRDGFEYMLSKGIVLTAETDGEVKLTGYSDPGFLYRLRDSVSSRFRMGMGEEAGGFAASLLLGDRSHLDDRVVRDFRTLGISHILAISGTHLTMLFAFAGTDIFRKHRLLRFCIISPLVLTYAVFTGMSASVLRAGIMMIIAAVASVLNKKSDSFTSLSVSALVICLVNPFAPYDVGLRLSFVCVLGIMLAVRMSRSLSDGKSKAVAFVIHTAVYAIVVPLAALPVMWLTFGETSLISPLSNVVFLFVISQILVLLIILAAISWITVLYVPLSAFAGWIITLILKIARVIAESSDPVIPMAGILPCILILAFAICLVVAALSGKEMRRYVSSVGIVLLCTALTVSQGMVYLSNRDMTVCCVSAGSGEALCIVSEGYSVLVDMGNYPVTSGNAARSARAQGIGRFDALVIPDVQKSHALALTELVGSYYVKSLWLPYDSENTPMLTETAQLMGLDVNLYVPDELLCFGDAQLSVSCTGSGKDTVIHCAVDRSENCVEYSSDTGITVKGKSDDMLTVIPSRIAKGMSAVTGDDIISDNVVIEVGKDGCRVMT